MFVIIVEIGGLSFDRKNDVDPQNANTVRIYDREHCICDTIKNKNKMDIQVFQMAKIDPL